MSKYIKVEDAIHAAISGCAAWDGGYFPSMDGPIEDAFKDQENKCIEIVRCRECRCGIVCVIGQHLGLDGFCSKGEKMEVQE